MDGGGYPEGKSYYRTHIDLEAVPIDIPLDTINVYSHHNMISRLRGSAFLMLTQCKALYLGNNLISVVEADAFNGLRSLTDLHLHTNRLERLYTNMFNKLVKCETMDIQMNQISEIEPGSFNGLSALKILSVSKNRLTVLTSGMLLGLGSSLEELFLTYNAIDSIEDGTFASLNKLRTLMLYGNDLEQLSPGTLTGLASLETLNIEGNRLTSLSAAAFGHLPRPLTLALYDGMPNMTSSHNALLCDARLCWLKQEEEAGTIRLEDMMGASTPWCSNGVNWDSWDCGLAAGQSDFRLNISIIKFTCVKFICTHVDRTKHLFEFFSDISVNIAANYCSNRKMSKFDKELTKVLKNM